MMEIKPIIVTVSYDGRQYDLGYEPAGGEFDLRAPGIIARNVETTMHFLINGRIGEPAMKEITLNTGVDGE